MLTKVYDLLITQLHIISINFINILSYYRCIRHLVFPALFLSISRVVIDYRYIISVTEYSKSVRLLLKLFKVPYYGALHFFQAHVTYVTLIIALTIQDKLMSLKSLVYTNRKF